MSHVLEHETIPVFAFELDREGRLSRKTMRLSREETLTNTLLQGFCPGIRVATVDVPTEPLDGCEQAMVEQALTRVEFDGIRYSLVGASGSAKKGKFYAVESRYEKKLAERFRYSPQAAMTYFGILVSSCKVMIEVPDCRVLVVEDRELGTNDCRGWLSEALFRRLQAKHRADLLADEMKKLIHANKNHTDAQHFQMDPADEVVLRQQAAARIGRKLLRGNRFYQFRLAFDKTQAKGSFKVMADDLAEKLEADIILPKSSVKPKYQGGVLRSICSALGDGQAHCFRGSALIGIRDVSRNLEFQSSYTLVEHAPQDSIELEIKPYALKQIDKLRKAWKENNFRELFQLLGTQENQCVLEDEDIEEPDPDYTSSEYTVADGALVADGTGYMLKHPFVNAHLQKVLARWAYRLCTSGGFRLPGFALADDGSIIGFSYSVDQTTATSCFTTGSSSRIRTGFRKTTGLLKFHPAKV